MENLLEKLNEYLNFQLLEIGSVEVKIYSLLSIAGIIVVTRVLVWIARKTLYARLRRTDEGNAYALFQIIRYIFYVIAFALILETIGLKLTFLLAGSAALLVGVGLGLQQTFLDFISGIILLTEGSIKIGDVLEVDGEIIMMQSIGLRTSKGLTRNDINIIIPNSQITNNKLINWSHQSELTRFDINVGVAYGSDVELVTRLLEESAREHPEVQDSGSVLVFFKDFGNSSLDFQLFFFSSNVFRIERVKSDIRRAINRKFIENGVTIPFPQVDVHMK